MLDQHLIAKVRPRALEENKINFGDYRITVLTQQLFRIEKDKERIFCDEATQAVWYRDMPGVDFQAEQTQTDILVKTDKVSLVLKEDIYDSYALLHNGRKVSLNDEENLMGTYRTLDGCDGALWIPFGGDPAKARLIKLDKGVMAKNGVAVFDDSASLILQQNGFLAERRSEEKDLYVFAYGHDYRAALKALYQLCGPTPLIPRFALGNWWSRYHAYTQKEYLHLMERFEREEIPFTVATVDMDWHWSNDLDERKQITASGKNDELHGGADGWTGYSWNTDLFPDYKSFLQKLHKMNLKITLNLHPALGVRFFEDQYEDMAKAMGVDPSTEQQIRFDIADENYVNAYFKVLHKPYEHDGVDFWWIDWQQGSKSGMKGLDPLWALNHYHYLDNGLEHQPLILSRYCGIGSHRYPLGFSGDTHVTWRTLSYLPYFTATASNAGYTWWSHDIGGHMNGYKDDELYVRFVQFGVFSPINRLHCTDIATFTKEPQAYKNGTGKIIEEFLKLRHRMIPFLYSASYETREQGAALIEPMYYEYPEREEAYQAVNQYLFGGQLLVAPVVTKSEGYGMSETRVWLPEGKWTDIFTGDEYQGGQTMCMVRYLDSLPVMAGEGGIFVLDGRRHTNSVDNPDVLEIWLYNGNGRYTLHEDDNGVRADTEFVMEKIDEGTQSLTLQCPEERPGAAVKHRDVELIFKNIKTGDVAVRRNNESISVQTDDNGAVSVWLEDICAGAKYEITVSFRESKKEKRAEAIRQAITCMEYKNDKKNELYSGIISLEKEQYIRYVSQCDLPDIFKKRLLELA